MAPFDVVFVHGYFHNPKQSTYEPLLAALRTAGFTTHFPSLPTSDDHSILTDTRIPRQSDDAASAHAELQRVVGAGKDVLVVAHSAGGVAATEAVTPDLDKPARKAKGLAGGVIGILYLVAQALPPGYSQYRLLSENIAPEALFGKWGFKSWPAGGDFDPASLFSYWILDPKSLLYHDLPDAEAEKWAVATQATLLYGPQNDEFHNMSYQRLPVAYLKAGGGGDRIIAPAMQDKVIGYIKEHGGQVKEYECSGGHSVHLSYTDGVVDIVKEFGGSLL